jgi:Ala-tRNA(Pro) deacylase
MPVFEKLVELFDREKAKYRVVEHEPEGRSDLVAALRKMTVSQGAKAIVCKIKTDTGECLVLAVLAGDKRLDIKAVARCVGGKKGSFAPPELTTEITGCQIGAIPPLSFDGRLRLVVDKDFLDNEAEIAFNAGRLDRSIIMDSKDYIRIASPRIEKIAALDMPSMY